MDAAMYRAAEQRFWGSYPTHVLWDADDTFGGEALALAASARGGA